MKKIIPAGAILIPDTAKQVFSGEIFSVYQWQQQIFDSTMRTFEMLKRSDTASVICLVEDKIIVIDDEQPHAGVRQSFPGGQIDDSDKDVLAGAQREVLEETGYKFKNWRLIKVHQPVHKVEWFVYVYLAWDTQSLQFADPGPGEKITVKLKDFAAVKSKIMRRVGYLGESRELFEPFSETKQLLSIPEFKGIQIER